MNKARFIQNRKGGPPIAALTAYDYTTARLLDETGIEILLVGDSLGMVVLGYPDTTHVTMEHMCHHLEAVSRGAKEALIVGDLPIHSYETASDAVINSQKLVDAGAQAVKLEGGLNQIEKVTAIIEQGIPVMGHLGMLPQSIKEEKGYKKKGKTEQEIDQLMQGALALQESGVFSLVLESVLPHAARLITEKIRIPTIGIGCGENTCDGEIAVISDVVGSYPWFVPPFAKPKADLASEITRATKEYLKDLGK